MALVSSEGTWVGATGEAGSGSLSWDREDLYMAVYLVSLLGLLH